MVRAEVEATAHSVIQVKRIVYFVNFPTRVAFCVAIYRHPGVVDMTSDNVDEIVGIGEKCHVVPERQADESSISRMKRTALRILQCGVFS